MDQRVNFADGCIPIHMYVVRGVVLWRIKIFTD